MKCQAGTTRARPVPTIKAVALGGIGFFGFLTVMGADPSMRGAILGGATEASRGVVPPHGSGYPRGYPRGNRLACSLPILSLNCLQLRALSLSPRRAACCAQPSATTSI